MHGLGFSTTIRRLIYGVYVVMAVIVYHLGKGVTEIHEIIRIPITDYLILLLLYGAFWLLNQIMEKCGFLRETPENQGHSSDFSS